MQMIRQTQFDDLLAPEQAEALTQALDRIAHDLRLSDSGKLESMSLLIKNAVDQIYHKMRSEFGAYDDRIMPLVNKPNGRVPVKFVDGVLRSQNAFPLSKLADHVDRILLANKKLEHDVAGKTNATPIEVFNRGEKVGVLRFNPAPHDLTPDDIAVFDQMPGETAPVGGIITLGIGARLSHLQLLAKSLHIPNAKFSKEYVDILKRLSGKRVRYSIDTEGRVHLSELQDGGGNQASAHPVKDVKIPVPDHSVTVPISFKDIAQRSLTNIAGPKGLNLAPMGAHASLVESVPDGFVIPFGFFNDYAQRTGLKRWLDLLSKVNLKNQHLVASITETIARHIQANPIPSEMLDQVMSQLRELKQRTGHEGGYFFRSDTNIEDLPGFNGAGLNESVPNVKDERALVQKAIQDVWISPFREKSIYWRAMALPSHTVTLAEPSVVVMPTVHAKSSGVILSRGGSGWQSGHGSISANWGIGSVVQAGDPVEEISLASGKPLRTSFTVSTRKPVANVNGGLSLENVPLGQPVLTEAQIQALNKKAAEVEEALGHEPHGWDIEWAIDSNDNVKILQARPNM